MSSRGKEFVESALRDKGYDMDAFLVAHTGRTLAEMAAILGVPTQTFITYYNSWVDNNAPPLWEDDR